MIKPHPFIHQVACDEQGNVYSTKTGKIRKVFKRKNGYVSINISRTINSSVHRLVAQTFLGIDESRPYVNHKNGIPSDNRLCNLEWVTPRENIIHARDVLKLKCFAPGFESPKAKVSPKEQRMIWRMYNLGLNLEEMASVLEYSLDTISVHVRKGLAGGDKSLRIRGRSEK